MFDDSTPAPRLFALPPGVDYPAEVLAGIEARMGDAPPEAWGRVTIYVNTARMGRRLAEVLGRGPARLGPRIRLITELAADPLLTDLPPALPPLRRRLELARLVGALLEAADGMAPRSARFALAESLAGLIDEMQGEGVTLDDLERLDVESHAAHWQRALEFLRIAAGYAETSGAPDPEARQRAAVQALAARWAETPPKDPVLVVGSTGSRGTTFRLMQAVAKLPQGAVILPGVDLAMPGAVWDQLGDALAASDHPQYRFADLCAALELDPAALPRWTDADPAARRNQVVSLALRPAPVTDQWLNEGPALDDLPARLDGWSLIEAADPRQEAMAIALRLRQAAEDGVPAALVTPDRLLARRVAAQLDRWGIEPDDSGGRPLALSAAGRFLRQVAEMMGAPCQTEALLSLLKNPICHSGPKRGDHLLRTRELELWLRRQGRPFTDAGALDLWATRDGARDGDASWAQWLGLALTALAASEGGALEIFAARHLELAEALARGAQAADGAGALWEERPGEMARQQFDRLAEAAPHGGDVTPADYAALLNGLLAEELRSPVQPHRGVMVFGTLEARGMAVPLVILGGLNDGIWPPRPGQDPWLNRKMRHDAGLLLPDRRIGLSAHDFQLAIAAPEVVLTRARRDAEAETVPSRWLNRITNLLSGLPDQGGDTALAAMRARGSHWCALAARADLPAGPPRPEPRPCPAPPVALRPEKLSITEIQKLIRDPYAIYARHVLGLRPVDPLRPAPDAMLKGIVIHEIMEGFAESGIDPAAPEAAEAFLAIARKVLAAQVPWPVARQIWEARMGNIAPWFLAEETRRRAAGIQTERSEAKGEMPLPCGFALHGRADRIDRRPDGRLEIVDYKTGQPPSAEQLKHFDKQLLLEAAMAESGAFEGLDAAEVAAIAHVSLGSKPGWKPHSLREGDEDRTGHLDPDRARAELAELIAAYRNPAKGYVSRRAMETMGYAGDYDQLARFGEWEATDPARATRLGEE